MKPQRKRKERRNRSLLTPLPHNGMVGSFKRVILNGKREILFIDEKVGKKEKVKAPSYRIIRRRTPQKRVIPTPTKTTEEKTIWEWLLEKRVGRKNKS